MKTQIIDLYEQFGLQRKDGAQGVLSVYSVQRSKEFCPKRKRPAMLVLGGGAYAYVSDREKEPIALYYLSQGFNVFVLEYSVAPLTFPTALIEACMAMAYIRENADEFCIDKKHVVAIGFSAGGHLLGTLSTMYDCAEVKFALGEKYKLCRPDASIFSYPVVSSDKTISHQGSIDNLCAGDEKIIKRVSIEKNVTKDVPPAFIWTTVDDACVPSENSLELAYAYKRAGVPFELHIFETGVHGLSVATKETNLENKAVRAWLELSVVWLKNRGFDFID